MPSRKKFFEVGERVVVQGKPGTIEAIEKPSKKHPTLDMGRYTIRYDAGGLHHNAPGYLIARPGAIRRGG